MVRQALACAQPPRKTPVRAALRLDSAKALIDVMLTEDLDAPRKQRHTAGWVLARLVGEHGLAEITYSTVRDYVRVRRGEVWAAAGWSLGEVFWRRPTSRVRRPRWASPTCGSFWVG
jgi:hypothetical protein